MKVINLLGGPCLGKSVLAADIFSELKKANINAEYIPEYAKSLVWEERTVALANQIYVFAKQVHAQVRVNNKVDYAVTDSPLIINLAYAEHMPECYKELVLRTYNEFDNINLVLAREFQYQPEGRTQKDVNEAVEKDILITNILDSHNIPYVRIFPSSFNVKQFISQLK